jgi:hypothetical protein
VKPPTLPRPGTLGRSRIDRLALRIAARSPTPATAPPGVSAPTRNGQLSRRKLLTRALAGSALLMLPLRLANPSAANAEGYCEVTCLGNARAAADARLSKCFVSAFGVDFPNGATSKEFAAYVASKIKSGGVGALLIVNEIASFERCAIVRELRYNYDAGQCGKPNCGNPNQYPPPGNGTGACPPAFSPCGPPGNPSMACCPMGYQCCGCPQGSFCIPAEVSCGTYC